MIAQPTAAVVPVHALLGAGQSAIEPYGVKTQGYVELMALQQGSPVGYMVPPAWAIPPLSKGSFGERDIRRAFEDLAEGLPEKAVLMARSSALGEESGANPTYFVPYDRADREGSYRRFAQRVDELVQSSRDMGVLATRTVGRQTALDDGTPVFGLTNVSFTADTHNAVSRGEMHVALVHGLGTKSVEGDEAIHVCVMRESGLLTFFGNQNDATAMGFTGSFRPVDEVFQYRQRGADFLDLASGDIRSHPLDRKMFVNTRDELWMDDEGLHVWLPSSNRTHSKTRFIGLAPFGSLAMYNSLVSILQYLGRRGPRQIEGAFETRTSAVPYLYQLIDVSDVETDSTPIGVENPFLISDYVIGKGKHSVPLVWVTGDVLPGTAEYLRKLDTRFAPTGYALLAHVHRRDIFRATPACKIRLSLQTENPSSHAWTMIRNRLGRDPNSGYVMAMRVSVEDEGQQLKPDSERFGVKVFNSARIESNGSRMALVVLRRRSWLGRLWPKLG